MRSPDALTDEQRAIVQHGAGPAVVLAVPGAGKTTTLVHRIRHLVEERGVPPSRILVCSFNRDTVQDLTAGLTALDLQAVDARTLHSLGYTLVQRAGTHPNSSSDRLDNTAQRLARQSLRAFAAKQNLDRADLDISASDLVDQIAAWKQQLAYPDPDAADLPATAREGAQKADHENEDYLTLYRHFETRRQQTGVLTFPDMLRDGWEALMRNDSLRADAQEAYDYVMVDEFQDVSRAQFQILDVLTASHRNYVVVGDDDQCIYGWRGASPTYLRTFAERYDATTYRMQSSFRLPAAPLVLANAVIRHNETRHPKQLRLTRGLEGDAHLIEADNPHDEAAHIADAIRALQTKEAYPLNQMTILVRTYGQTPPLEQEFLERDLPYLLHGAPPFYRRREVQTLLRYLYWALLERHRRTKGQFENPQQAQQYVDRFAQIINAPNRYVARGRIDRITQEALEQQESVLDATARHLPGMHDRTAKRVDSFLTTADTLVDRMDDPAHDTLTWLVETIGYESALRERSASPERGDSRVQTVQALVRYATSHEDTPALLHDVQSLAASRSRSDESKPAIDVRSIHRAKGLEWPIVFVPGCTDGTLPLTNDGSPASALSEERRLFYVAVTRTREQLYLSTNGTDKLSPFLDEAETDTRIPLLRSVRQALSTDPEKLSDEAVADLCRGIKKLDLEPFVQYEWTPSADQAKALRARLDDLSSAITEAVAECAAHRRARKEYEQAQEEARSAAHERLQEFRDALGNTTFTAHHLQPETFYPEDARFQFGWSSDETEIAVYWDDNRVATLDPLGVGPLDTQTVLSLPWDQMVGRFAGVGQRRQQLRFSIDWEATQATWSATTMDTVSAPDPPSDRTRLLTRNSVQEGCTLLQKRLDSLRAE